MKTRVSTKWKINTYKDLKRVKYLFTNVCFFFVGGPVFLQDLQSYIVAEAAAQSGTYRFQSCKQVHSHT